MAFDNDDPSFQCDSKEKYKKKNHGGNIKQRSKSWQIYPFYAWLMFRFKKASEDKVVAMSGGHVKQEAELTNLSILYLTDVSCKRSVRG